MTRIGKIYALVNLITCQCYVGSTFQTIQQRAKQRKTSYNRWLQGKDLSYKHDHKLFENIYEYGWMSFIYCDLETVKTVDPRVLREREQHWIDRLNAVKKGLNSKRENVNVRKDIIAYCKNWYKQNSKRYVCGFCDYSTPFKTNMDNHLKTIKHDTAVKQYYLNNAYSNNNNESSQDTQYTTPIIQTACSG